MADQNFQDNTIYELDNLDVLRGMNSETVDLIATDPPFNTRQNRFGTAGHYVDNWKWGDTGKLPDQRAWNEVHPVWLDEIKDENRALFEVIEAAGHCHGQDIAAFLCFLSVRLLEMHRVLKPTGSLYLHCDHTANAYIRMAMDAIFGAKNFRNEIVWVRNVTRKGDMKKALGHDTDNIFRYSKGNDLTWNREAVTKPYNLQNLSEKTRRQYNKQDHDGRLWRLTEITDPHQNPESSCTYEVMGVTRTWRWTKDRMKREINSGRIVQISPGNVPRYKRYLDEQKGLYLNNVWDDIPNLTGTTSERTGSPDQKPLALYEKFVLASSNKGDLVLDPFAGCATTIMAAQKNGRRWVGIDRRPDARFHIICRMEGIRAKDAEYIRKLPLLTNWIDARLAQHDAQFRTEPPTRSDGGDAAAPVYTTSEKSTLTHRQIEDYLVETFGLQCWACDFKAPDERYLQLDHVDPRADGGSNDLDNRVLLCQPCNLAKSDRITLIQLRRENAQNGYLTKPAGIKRGQDGHPIDLPNAQQKCREALEMHRQGQTRML